MNNLRNNVRLVGHAGSDLMITPLENDKKIGRVSIAINDYSKSKSGEDSRPAQWFNLIFWNAKADVASSLIKKGMEIAVEGKLSSQFYVAKDGQKRYTTEIVVNEFELVQKPAEVEA